MKSIPALVVVLVCATTAQASPRDALTYIRDAMDEVKDEGGRCKKDMFEDLREVQDNIRDKDFKAARKLLNMLARDASKCPAHVGKLLRRATDAFDDERDDRDDDRRDRRRDRDRDDRRDDRREEPKVVERAKNVPWADFNADCKALWMIVEIARFNTDDATINKLAALSGTACGGGGLAPSNWPNGTVAKSSNGTFYYPNGTTAKSGETYYYPNGTTAKSGATWYFPNGTTARSGATWYYPNGTQAGGFQMLVTESCSRSAPSCNRYKGMLASDVEDWRTFAVVQLAAQAYKH